MSDVVAPVTPAAAPSGAPPNGAQKPIAAKAPDTKPAPPVEVDDSEEYIVDGKPVRWTKAQRQLNFQKAIAADKRLKEAADKRAQADDLIKLFETDPEAALAKAGKDPAKLIAEHLAKKAKLELMTPEQREADKLQRERDEWRTKAEAAEKEKQSAHQAEVDKRNFSALESQLIGAADRHGLDSSPETLQSLCDIALEFLEYEVLPSADQIAKEHLRREREHIEKRDKRLLSVLSGKKLLDYLGADGLSKVKAALAEADAASLNDIPKPQARPKVQVKAHEREVKGYVREADFDKKFLK